MTASLPPALALAYLQELSVDVRAAVVLNAAGEAVAGDPELAVRARALLASAPGASAGEGALLIARTPDGGAIAVMAGSQALRPLLAHDLAAAAENVVTAPNSP